jgi:hypothetical protein
MAAGGAAGASWMRGAANVSGGWATVGARAGVSAQPDRKKGDAQSRAATRLEK